MKWILSVLFLLLSEIYASEDFWLDGRVSFVFRFLSITDSAEESSSISKTFCWILHERAGMLSVRAANMHPLCLILPGMHVSVSFPGTRAVWEAVMSGVGTQPLCQTPHAVFWRRLLPRPTHRSMGHASAVVQSAGVEVHWNSDIPYWLIGLSLCSHATDMMGRFNSILTYWFSVSFSWRVLWDGLRVPGRGSRCDLKSLGPFEARGMILIAFISTVLRSVIFFI